MTSRNISAVPIIDHEGVVLNIFESIDVLSLIRAEAYHDLEITVGEALLRRPDDFEGVHTCMETDRLDGIFDAIRRSRLHRLVVVGTDGRLRGIVSLSDILNYFLR